MQFDALADLVAVAPGRLVLPDRPRGARHEVPAPLRLVDAFPLSDGLALAVVADAAAGLWAVPLCVYPGQVRRAAPGDGAAEALLRELPTGGVQEVERFTLTGWFAEPAVGERAVEVDQTNDSVVVGDTAVVKWSVRLPTVPLPGTSVPARLNALVAQGFSGIPRPWGQLSWRRRDGSQVPVASVASFLPGARDGWEWAVDDVRGLATGQLDLPAALVPAARLGDLVAGMHVALAATGVHRADDAAATRWRAAASEDLTAALAAASGPHGQRLAARRAQIEAAFDHFRQASGTPTIDVHGDLHVGQVLRFGEPADYAVTDFDGNPVLPDDERLLPRPAAFDVAGMLASLDHVARVVVRHTDGVDPARVEAWIGPAQGAFLARDRDGLARAQAGHLLDERLLRPFRVHQECREFLYAAQHLPHWQYVPDASLTTMFPLPGGG